MDCVLFSSFGENCLVIDLGELTKPGILFNFAEKRYCIQESKNRIANLEQKQ